MALQSLSFDIFSVLHCESIPPLVLQALRNLRKGTPQDCWTTLATGLVKGLDFSLITWGLIQGENLGPKEARDGGVIFHYVTHEPPQLHLQFPLSCRTALRQGLWMLSVTVQVWRQSPAS